MVYVDNDSDAGAWTSYVEDMENIRKVTVLTTDKQRIAELEQKLQKAEKKIRKLERANELLAELAV